MFLDDEDLDARIERLRKGNFSVRFVDARGKASPAGTKIAYRMTRIGFDLGTVLYWSIFQRAKRDVDRKNYLKKIDAYFNTVVIPIFWHRMEIEKRKFDEDIPCGYGNGVATRGRRPLDILSSTAMMVQMMLTPPMPIKTYLLFNHGCGLCLRRN